MRGEFKNGTSSSFTGLQFDISSISSFIAINEEESDNDFSNLEEILEKDLDLDQEDFSYDEMIDENEEQIFISKSKFKKTKSELEDLIRIAEETQVWVENLIKYWEGNQEVAKLDIINPELRIITRSIDYDNKDEEEF